MKNFIDKKRESAALEKVMGGVWGTIGPNFCKLIETLGKPYGVKYALATFSNTAALEAVLRGMEIGYGDEVIVSDYSLPEETSVTVAVGATPVFCDVCEKAPAMCVKKIEERVTSKTKAVIADLTDGCDVKSISEFCRNKGIYFILNTGDAFGATADGTPVAQYADAAIADMSEGSVWNVGYAGAVLTDNKELFDSFFAYHNCGRPFGEGCTLSFGGIIGGDLRIAEWQACLLAERAEKTGEIPASEKRPVMSTERFAVMHNQPLVKSDYYKSYTGSTRVYTDAEFPNVKKFGL